jgi:hypothetical protein
MLAIAWNIIIHIFSATREANVGIRRARNIRYLFEREVLHKLTTDGQTEGQSQADRQTSAMAMPRNKYSSFPPHVRTSAAAIIYLYP